MKQSHTEVLNFVDAFVRRRGRAPSYTEMEVGLDKGRGYLHRIVQELCAAGRLRRDGTRGNLQVVGQKVPEPAELRECLYRLKTECETEGLAQRPGFDKWLAMANSLLNTEPAAPAKGARA